MMMNIECPRCDFDNEVDTEALADNACDSVDFECCQCDYVFKIGWFAEVELR